MNEALVTQSVWAKRLGISVSTFRSWRADGRIPIPTNNPGWPRWSAEVVEAVTRELQRAGQGRYFRTAESRRRQRGFESRSSRFVQGKGAGKSSRLASEQVVNLHGESVGEAGAHTVVHSIAGER